MKQTALPTSTSRRFGLATLSFLAVAFGSSAARAQQVTLAVESLPAMPQSRMVHWQVPLADGRVLALGGHGSGFVSLASGNLLDLELTNWSTIQLADIHDGAALTELEDGRYLVAGSAYDLGIPATAGVTLIDPQDGSATAATSMNSARTNCSAATLKGVTSSYFYNGNIAYVLNGPTAPTIITVAEPITVASLMTYHWNFGSGTSVVGTVGLRHSDGTLYGPWQAEGSPGQGGVQNAYWTARPFAQIPAGTYEVVDSDPTTWAHNSQSEGRGFAELYSTTSPLQGHALVVGAWYDTSAASVAETYNPHTNAWTNTGPLNSPRSLPMIVALNDGSALLFGGIAPFGNPPIERVERYDPLTNTFSIVRETLLEGETGWSVTSNFHRQLPQESQLPDGRILFFARRSNPNESQIISIDPATGGMAKWGPTPIPAGDPAINWSSLPPLVDMAREAVIVMGTDSTQPRASIHIQLFDFDGTSMGISNAVTIDSYLDYSCRTLMADGSIIQTGGHLSDNFDAVASVRRFMISQQNEIRFVGWTID